MKPPLPFTLSRSERARLLGVARGLLGSQADAEDALHEAWLRVMTGAPLALDQPVAWLTTVMKNLALDGLRRRRLERDNSPGPLEGRAPSAEEETATRQRCAQALRRLADTLAPADAAMLLLHEVFGFSHADIAERAGKSEAACRQAVHRALLRLRQADAGEPEDRATADALYLLCLRALQQHSAAPLHAILASTVSARAAVRACAVADVSSAQSGVVQLEGGYALVLAHEGRVLCCLPLGPVAAANADLA